MVKIVQERFSDYKRKTAKEFHAMVSWVTNIDDIKEYKKDFLYDTL